ncbi:DsbA family protein [Lactobacillus ultunensis]|nr:DsbA family protein [Lactobacillus ultunensis]QQP27649.1 DsbA family protein [Lactobacillus ultunensis]
MDKIQIRIFADPMMGMHWELWPVLRKLLVKLDNQIDLDFMPVELVKDIYNFVDQSTLARYGKKVALNTYWAKLMQIYLQEQQISSMPIIMGSTGKHLFDEEHTSSRNLILAYLAMERLKPESRFDFLYAIQQATVLQDKQTTDLAILQEIANKYGVNESQFIQTLNSNEVENEFDQLQRITEKLQIKQLPSATITYHDKTYLANALINYSQWVELLEKITGNKLTESDIPLNSDSLEKIMAKFETISAIELEELFDIDDETELKTAILPLIKQNKVKESKYRDVSFYKRIKNEN